MFNSKIDDFHRSNLPKNVDNYKDIERDRLIKYLKK